MHIEIILLDSANAAHAVMSCSQVDKNTASRLHDKLSSYTSKPSMSAHQPQQVEEGRKEGVNFTYGYLPERLHG